MKDRSKNTKCSVNGNFKLGKLSGICKHIKVGESGICGAHGNLKCEHKIKIKEVE